jgi:hypothetical protein
MKWQAVEYKEIGICIYSKEIDIINIISSLDGLFIAIGNTKQNIPDISN